MCGIVGAVAQRNVTNILIEGLKCLEYRGYDSAGLAVLDQGQIKREREPGKVIALEKAVAASGVMGASGIAHTRWATHGSPSQDNAHPHISGDVAVVHNGIIENYEELREFLQGHGYVFTSQTDTEVVAHLIQYELETESDFLRAVKKATKKLQGAYALCILRASEMGRLIAVRRGSPLVIGLGRGENFIGSDQMALYQVSQRFIYLEEGDVVDLYHTDVIIYDADDQQVRRDILLFDLKQVASDKGPYRHYMLKEIHEQPQAIQRTLEGRLLLNMNLVHPKAFGLNAMSTFNRVRHVHIIACGTSYNAGCVARYWMEQLAGISCTVEVASEFRYRKSVLPEHTLLVAISQSGETADTLAGFRCAKSQGILAALSICNVATSTLVRESDLSFMTHAGPEIGVASTKAFTTQLVALMLLVLALGRARSSLSIRREVNIVKQLQSLPVIFDSLLAMKTEIALLAESFIEKNHALYLGRGGLYPVAIEGALKLKETSYIHAEAYPAGELKHGPLALVDSNMPIVVIAPNNELIDKLKSNLQEVSARGGKLYVFADRNTNIKNEANITVMAMPTIEDEIAPIVYVVPLQLLAYYAAVMKGTDVDQPRNLAKSVTVE
jgi:glucosamine--fructose-6-phosphate aminotransferase (isomerizing)